MNINDLSVEATRFTSQQPLWHNHLILLSQPETCFHSTSDYMSWFSFNSLTESNSSPSTTAAPSPPLFPKVNPQGSVLGPLPFHRATVWIATVMLMTSRVIFPKSHDHNDLLPHHQYKTGCKKKRKVVVKVPLCHRRCIFRHRCRWRRTSHFDKS